MEYYNGHINDASKKDNEDIWMSELQDSRRDCRFFIANFFGTTILTTLTSNPSVIRRWISKTLFFHRYWRHKLVVGLGVQWSPSTDGGYSDDSAHTLQLCIGTRCLIIKLSYCPHVPSLLTRFLADKQISFVGIRNYSDEKKLLGSRHRLSVSNIQSLGKIVATETCDRRHLGAAMETLASDVLGIDGVNKDPLIARSDWNAKYLTVEQVQYACVDARVSFLIGRKFKAWKF